jgi:hypothetical protein
MWQCSLLALQISYQTSRAGVLYGGRFSAARHLIVAAVHCSSHMIHFSGYKDLASGHSHFTLFSVAARVAYP